MQGDFIVNKIDFRYFRKASMVSENLRKKNKEKLKRSGLIQVVISIKADEYFKGRYRLKLYNLASGEESYISTFKYDEFLNVSDYFPTEKRTFRLVGRYGL